MMTELPASSVKTLCRYGFYFSLIFFFYGTLFPFHFDFLPQELLRAWSQAERLPYWDVERGRIPSVPDAPANILLTFPIGFFAVLHFSAKRQGQKLSQWLLLGLALGAAAELLQLAVPWRSSSVTEALNNGVGAIAGACTARLVGVQLFEFLCCAHYRSARRRPYPAASGEHALQSPGSF